MMNIAVIAKDYLGDHMHLWPALRLLEHSILNCDITIITTGNTIEVAAMCPHIAAVINANDLTKLHRRYDIVMAFSNDSDIVSLYRRMHGVMKIMPVPYQDINIVGGMVQLRNGSLKPEWALNVEVVEHVLKQLNIVPVAGPLKPYAPLGWVGTEIGIHVCNGVSSPIWNIDNYFHICLAIWRAFGIKITLTCSVREKDKVSKLKMRLRDYGVIVNSKATGTFLGLVDQIERCRVFVAGSTGPLHVAGICGIPTVGMYPKSKDNPHTRWAPPSAGKAKHIPLVYDSFKDVSVEQIETIVSSIRTLLK